MRPSEAAIREAREFLGRHLPVTRLVAAPSLSAETGSNVHLKLESELPTGSFKPRGALFALWANVARRKVREVVASSTGNHGAAVAFAARLLGVQATIFLPEKDLRHDCRWFGNAHAGCCETSRDPGIGG